MAFVSIINYIIVIINIILNVAVYLLSYSIIPDVLIIYIRFLDNSLFVILYIVDLMMQNLVEPKIGNPTIEILQLAIGRIIEEE